MREVLHIGYPKTASTFLQTHVFPRLDACAFLPSWGERAAEFRPLARNLYWADDEEYLEHTLRTFLAEWREAHPGTFVLSDENLAGGLFPIYDNWSRNAVRVHRLLPDAHVLVVVREQVSHMRSAYALHVQRGGYTSLADLLDGRAERARFVPDVFCYHHLVLRYRELFGEDRVTVLPYEWLSSDEPRFNSSVASLVHGMPTELGELRAPRENVSLTAPSRWIMRRSNRMFRRSTYNARPTVRNVELAHRLRPVLHSTVDRLVPRQLARRLDAAEVPALEHVLDRYAESNAILAELTGVDLGDLGYVMPARELTPTGTT